MIANGSAVVINLVHLEVTGYQVLKLLRGVAEVTAWARLELGSSGGSDPRLQVSEDEGFSQSNLRSHLNNAFK
ncbi:hypothetical protein Tco_0680734 [Tanacetum coccineum]|uniref:Uncharacterized protein n=1 Tax=Tanacetum coccineum TaxID=301880 RepID=A0ABQ4XMH8_9ASTR